MSKVLGVDFNYVYDGKLLTEIFFKPSVNTPSLDQIARIIPGQKYKAQATLVGTLSKIIKANDGCDRTVTGSGIDMTNKTIPLTPLEMYLTQCKEDFEDGVGTILSEEWLRSGIEEFDLGGTRFEGVINQLIEDALRRDVFRIFSFSDTVSVNTDYNSINGLWTRLIADSGSGASYCVRRIGRALGTGTLGSGAAIAALKAHFEGAAIILKQLPTNQKAFFVTGSVWENLMASYEANVNGTERQFGLLTDGANALTYRGIPVIPVYAWDESLADTANPLNSTTRHLILYTTRENHAIGVDNSADLNRVSGWYDRDSRLYKFESFMRMGYEYLHCDLQTISY